MEKRALTELLAPKRAMHPVDVMINLFMGERNGHRSSWESLMMGLEAREVK